MKIETWLRTQAETVARGVKPDQTLEWTAADTIADLRRQLAEIKELYEAGCAQWNPVYEIVLNERDDLRRQLAEAQALAGEHWADLCLANEKNDDTVPVSREWLAELRDNLSEEVFSTERAEIARLLAERP